MIVKTKLQLLGTQVVQGKKDPSKFYNTVGFLDGLQSVNLMCDNVELFNELQKLPLMTFLECELVLNIGMYTNCKLHSAKTVSSEQNKK